MSQESHAIVAKALGKDSGDRYQTARDLVVDLRHVARRNALALSLQPAEKAPQRKLLPRWVMVAAAPLSAAAAIWITANWTTTIWSKQGEGSFVGNPLANASFTRLTNYEGAELDASISPDGNFVWFLSDRDGHFHVWLVQADGLGKAINLTLA